VVRVDRIQEANRPARCAGEEMPSFTDSSAGHASLPPVGFSSAIRMMRLRMFSGRRGRPTRDFHFQNSWKPLRCQPMSVSGPTITKALFQSNS
jgi:hypothetical protein